MTYATFFRDELVVFFVINYLRNMVETELFLMNFQNRGKKKLDTTKSTFRIVIRSFPNFTAIPDRKYPPNPITIKKTI